MSKPTPYTVLLPVLERADVARLLPVAAALARANGGEVLVLGIITVPADQPLSAGIVPAQQRREELHRLHVDPDTPVRTTVRVARTLDEGIHDIVREEGVDLLFLGWQGEVFSPERLFGPPIEQLLALPPCDLLVVKQGQKTEMRQILMPTRGGPHLALSSQVANALAEAHDGAITVLYATDPQQPIGPASLETIRELQSLPRVGRWLERISPAVPAIMHEVAAHDVVVVGATGRRFNPEQPVGPFGETALRESTGTVIIARRKLAELELRAIERFEALRDVSVTVDKWFAENTFDGDEFADVEQLLLHKARQGATISLVLPALNEAATIGPLIDTLKDALVDRVPLLDEIVLIDSRSTDRTVEIARELGIPVHVHQDVLPEYGTCAGKGEALWKSLHVLGGDLIVWIDTDIHNIHPRFVYGLIGPLLKDRRITFVKGFYRRPIRGPGGLQATGGGRVTELMARPVFNVFYPELSGLIQPLAGEQAGRREVLEQLPFFTGYGVETGLLIDLLEQFGLRAIGQVDLKRRVHRNQALTSLSTMAFTILQVAMKRLEQRQRLQFLSEVSRSMKLIQHDRDRFHVSVKELGDVERPPIATLPEYRAAGRREREAGPSGSRLPAPASSDSR